MKSQLVQEKMARGAGKETLSWSQGNWKSLNFLRRSEFIQLRFGTKIYFRRFFIDAAICLHISGGTAFPICFKCGIASSSKKKSSGKELNSRFHSNEQIWNVLVLCQDIYNDDHLLTSEPPQHGMSILDLWPCTYRGTTPCFCAFARILAKSLYFSRFFSSNHLQLLQSINF